MESRFGFSMQMALELGTALLGDGRDAPSSPPCPPCSPCSPCPPSPCEEALLGCISGWAEREIRAFEQLARDYFRREGQYHLCDSFPHSSLPPGFYDHF